MAARFFAIAEVGNFAFWLAVGSFASVLSELGLSEQIMRSVPGLRTGRSSYLRSALALRISSGLLTGTLVYLVSAAIRSDSSLANVGTFAFALALGFLDFLGAARRAEGRFGLEALESGLASSAGLGAAVWAAVTQSSFAGFQIALGSGTSVVVLLRLLALARACSSATGGSQGGLQRVVDSIRWLWLKSLVGWSFLDATVLLLTWRTSDLQIALFASAARLVGLMTQPFIALNWVFMPALAHARSLGRPAFVQITRQLNLIGLAAAPAGIAACTLIGHFMLTGFGREYRAAEPVLLMLALGFAANSAVINSVPLVVVGRERALVLVSILGAILAGAATYLLAPELGAIGGGIGVLAGLLVTKLATLSLYIRARVPLGGLRTLSLSIALVAWCLAAWALQDLARAVTLAAGGLLGGLFALRRLRATQLFAAGPAPRPGFDDPRGHLDAD